MLSEALRVALEVLYCYYPFVCPANDEHSRNNPAFALRPAVDGI
ncbi:MAG: hypothetical protein RMJ55_13540 [Roseiflexaceae bacterium]|nr:hypothetical protein [Roseiflexus sp.]MDW8214577.1 hypothetical protein [Roseiflexaceae bacterium]